MKASSDSTSSQPLDTIGCPLCLWRWFGDTFEALTVIPKRSVITEQLCDEHWQMHFAKDLSPVTSPPSPSREGAGLDVKRLVQAQVAISQTVFDSQTARARAVAAEYVRLAAEEQRETPA